MTSLCTLQSLVPITYGSLALNCIHFFQIFIENGCFLGSTHPFFLIFDSGYRPWRALSPEYMVSVEIIGIYRTTPPPRIFLVLKFSNLWSIHGGTKKFQNFNCMRAFEIVFFTIRAIQSYKNRKLSYSRCNIIFSLSPFHFFHL